MLPKRMPKDLSEETLEENMDDVSRNTGNGTQKTSEPLIVVPCPSCRTKFAVESSLVAAYDVPRFHCSRCDSVFDLKPERTSNPPSTKTYQIHPQTPTSQPEHSNSPQPAAPQLKQTTPRWILDDDSGQAPKNDDENRLHPTTALQSPLKSTDFTLGKSANPDQLKPRAPFEPIEDSAGLSILGFRPNASRRHSTSLTRNETQALISGIDADTSVALPKIINRQPQIETPLNPSLDSNAQNDPFALFDAPETHTKGSAVSSGAQTLSSAAPAPIKALPSNPATAIPKPEKMVAVRGNLSRLTTPLLATVGILCFISILARFMPLTMDSLFGSIVPGFVSGRTSHLPPAELSVQDLNLNMERTQSKETIPVIRGVVSNASEVTFEDVSIEALGFNSKGELLVRARAPLRSALSREKISDLSLETVKKFQSALSARDASIKPGEKVAFSIALFVEDAAPEEVTYFSARVFSVGGERR